MKVERGDWFGLGWRGRPLGDLEGEGLGGGEVFFVEGGGGVEATGFVEGVWAFVGGEVVLEEDELDVFWAVDDRDAGFIEVELLVAFVELSGFFEVEAAGPNV